MFYSIDGSLNPNVEKKLGAQETEKTETSSQPSTSTQLESTSFQLTQRKPRGIDRFIEKEKVTRAEIIWCLQTVFCHLSLSATGQCTAIFKLMFDENGTAQGMALARNKMGYIILHGLAPFFKNELLHDISSNECYVVAFDESLNKVCQLEQMDFVLRYWSKTKEETVSRYFGSAFLGHSTSADLLTAFKKELSSLNMKNLLQVSMDGPNVNLKFLRDLKDDLNNGPDSPVLLDIGSCGLHNLHNAFKAAMKATAWDIVQFLRAIYNIFAHVPARRADYIRFFGSHQFPLKFCAVRWLQNGVAAERAGLILKNLEKYIAGVQKEKKEPKSDSYELMKKSVKDKFIRAKLAFFKTIAAEVEPFLTAYQAEQPMVPYLYTDLHGIVISVMGRFVKEDVLEKTTSVCDVDVFKVDNLKRAKDVNIGHDTRSAFREMEGGTTTKDVLLFKQDCLRCLQVFCQKLQDKSPIKYRLTKALTFCDPTTILNSQKIALKRLSTALSEFVSNNWISGISADRIEREFKDLCTRPAVIELMKGFTRNERLDHFWKNVTVSNNVPLEFMSFLKKIFVMSHGNASVERGFSVNGECLVENQSQQSLIAQRLVWEGIRNAGGVDKVTITKEMIHYARNSCARYHEALDNQKKELAEADRQAKERKRANQIMKELQTKKRKVMAEAHREAEMLDDQIRAISKT